jgi:hypothetical protein
VAGQQYRHDQFQLSGGWDLRHPRPWDKMTAVTTTRNLTTERTYLGGRRCSSAVVQGYELDDDDSAHHCLLRWFLPWRRARVCTGDRVVPETGSGRQDFNLREQDTAAMDAIYADVLIPAVG